MEYGKIKTVIIRRKIDYFGTALQQVTCNTV